VLALSSQHAGRIEVEKLGNHLLSGRKRLCTYLVALVVEHFSHSQAFWP
jgi:hypothetical protein